MQIGQFSVARESFVYTAICLRPVGLSAVLQSNKCWFRVWREGLGRILSAGATTEYKEKLSLCSGASHVVKFFTVGGETGDRFFFFLFSLVSDGSLKKTSPALALTALLSLDKVRHCGWRKAATVSNWWNLKIWKRRIKNFFYRWEDSVGIFQWKGLHHLLCRRTSIHSTSERNTLESFFWEMAMDWDHRNREPSLSPAAFVNQVQYANILEGRFKQLQGKSYTDALIWL